MAERPNMADGVPTEVPQPAGPAQTGGVAPLERPGTESEKPTISPEDRDRLQQAGAILGSGIQLISDQGKATDKGKAILKAHYEAAGEPGKDGNPASVGNYTEGQLLRKARILGEAGFTREQRDKLMGEGITGLDVPDYLKEAKEAKRTESQFEQLRKWVEEYGEKSIDMSRLTLAQKDEYRRNLLENSLEIRDLINEAGAKGVLAFVMEDIRQIYAKVVPAPETATGGRRRRRRQSMYGDSSPEPPPKTADERIAEVRSTLADYQETFWEYGDAILRARFGTTDISGMKEAYQGVSKYVASKMAIAITKELKEIPPDPAGEIGDFFLQEVKRQFAENAAEAERQRQRQRRNAGPDEMLGYNPWRERFEFSWAETPEELERSVFAWIEKFEKHLPNETAEIVHQEAGKWKANAIGALEVAAHDLNISEKDPFYERLRSTIETYTNVLGGVKLLESDGGFEPYTGYLEAHAHNFNAHHDAIILGNAKSAIVQHFLSRRYRGAISLGAPRTIEKPLAGDLEDFRGNIEEQAKEYAATHELYIREEDFKNAILGEKEIRRQVAALGLSPADTEIRVKEILETRRRENEARVRKGESIEDRRYSWDDSIEDLLLEDSRGTDAAKVATRTGVFKEIKERLDREDGLAGLTGEPRRDVIRDRIKAKIRLGGKIQLLDEINGMNQADADAALWKYVKEFNKKMESQGHSLWSPSAWDFVRLSINTPTKLVDRVLSEDELEAMIEEVGSFKGAIGTTGVSVEIGIDGLTDEEIKAKIDALPGLNTTQRKELLEDALFNKQQRESEAERAFNINRSYQKFLGPDARWGGMVARKVNDAGDTEMINIWDEAEKILKDKIDREAADIEDKVTDFANTLPAGLTPAQIEAVKMRRRRLLRKDATFGATLALREIGIANDLPIWNYYYYNDPQRIQVFAPLLGLTHNDKAEIVQILDKGRREMRAVFDYLADKYMDGTILVVQDDPQIGRHKETWERARVINEATSATSLRDVFESRFMLSTSGGIKIVPLIAKIGDLGIYDLLWEMGCKDFREFQGFIKRRDEWELKRQSFWNTREWRDPITYAKRLRGAGAAITFLRGGEVKGQGRKPGTVQEPLMGAWRFRDEFFKDSTWKTVEIQKQINFRGAEFKAKIQELLENWDMAENIGPVAMDNLVRIGGEVLVTLIEYMDALRYKMNRAGFAPKNWELDNELIFKAWTEEVLNRSSLMDEAGKILQNAILGGAEKLGDEHMGYAVQGRSQLAVRVYTNILRTSSYHILEEADRKVLAKLAEETKQRMDEKRQEIIDRGLPAEVQARIAAREAKLLAKHTSPENVDREKARLKDQYIDEKMHKEFFGEWPARFVGIRKG